jgi:hypothetical protein
MTGDAFAKNATTFIGSSYLFTIREYSLRTALATGMYTFLNFKRVLDKIVLFFDAL